MDMEAGDKALYDWALDDSTPVDKLSVSVVRYLVYKYEKHDIISDRKLMTWVAHRGGPICNDDFYRTVIEFSDARFQHLAPKEWKVERIKNKRRFRDEDRT